MARSSLYGNMISGLPRWVLGGDFGDIANVLNNREIGYENVAQNQLQTDINQYKLDQLDQQQQLSDALEQQWSSGNRPASLRDAYESMIGLSADTGNPLMAVELMGKVADLEEQSKKKELFNLKNAIDIAQVVPGRVNEIAPGALSEAEIAKIFEMSQRRPQGVGRPAKERLREMIDPTDNSVQLIPESEFNAKAKMGWKPNKSSADPLKTLIAEMLGEAGLVGQSASESQKDLVEGIPDKYGRPPRAARPGMKWQQDTATGQFREVPK